VKSPLDFKLGQVTSFYQRLEPFKAKNKAKRKIFQKNQLNSGYKAKLQYSQGDKIVKFYASDKIS